MPPSAQSGYRAKDYFTYGIDLTNLTAGNSVPGNFTVDSGWDFMWVKATMLAVTSAGVVVDATNSPPNLTITIQETGSGRNLTNIPLPISSLFGTGALPFILPTSKLFRARSTVAVLVTNNTAATDYDDVYLSFIGTQCFR